MARYIHMHLWRKLKNKEQSYRRTFFSCTRKCRHIPRKGITEALLCFAKRSLILFLMALYMFNYMYRTQRNLQERSFHIGQTDGHGINIILPDCHRSTKKFMNQSYGRHRCKSIHRNLN